MEPILIAGEWRQAEAPSGAFSAVDPGTKTPLAESYPVSGLQDVTRAFAAAEHLQAKDIGIEFHRFLGVGDLNDDMVTSVNLDCHHAPSFLAGC